jgi:hypothetical protein
MSTLSHTIAIASLVLASACVTQVGGGVADESDDMDERSDVAGVDAGPPPDAAPPTFQGACGEADSDAHITTNDGTCYEYFFQGANWDGAQLKCQLLGGELATIGDAATNGILSSLVPSAFPTAWLGGTDEGSEGSWSWDGASMSYTNWRSGEPNNGSGGVAENCLIIESNLGGSWDDQSCAGTKSYICQR